jgi:AraC family transcriptional regulator
MQQPKARIAAHSAFVCGPEGQPVLRCPVDWAGPRLERYVTPSDAECGPQCTGVPTLFASRSGTGRRWYRSGHHVLELMTGPLIDTYSARYERDHARWSGTEGDSVCVRLPAEATLRMLHEDAEYFDLQTHYEVSDTCLRRIVLDLADEVESGFPNGRMYAEGLSLSLMGWLSVHYRAAPAPTVNVSVLSQAQKQRVCELFEIRLGEQLSVEDLAASVGLSPFHFSRVFKASFGEPPHRHLLRKRVERALTLLKSDRDTSIAEIAVLVGFASQAHLTAAFRRHTGMTPARWRSS